MGLDISYCIVLLFIGIHCKPGYLRRASFLDPDGRFGFGTPCAFLSFVTRALAVRNRANARFIMANKSIFQSLISTLTKHGPAADTTNFAGGSAYKFDPEHALCQYVATGCFNNTFYATAEDQLKNVLALANQVEPKLLAQIAIYARERGSMKDSPALLAAVLAQRDGVLLEQVFDRVIDSGKMLRNFVQIIRSGVVGRKSLGSRPKRLVRTWLEARSDEEIFFASVGNDPSLADVIRMVHPTPTTKSREALYGYLLNRPYDAEALPQSVKDYEVFKMGLPKA
jgi:60 kDa SS-A/Ro ribonucleoprotein